MSGRSALVRKKNTKAIGGRQPARPDPSSGIPFDAYGGGDDFAGGPGGIPGYAVPLGTGIGTTNARFLKFSDPAMSLNQGPVYYPESVVGPVGTPSVYSGGSGEGSGSGPGSYHGPRNHIQQQQQQHHPQYGHPYSPPMQQQQQQQQQLHHHHHPQQFGHDEYTYGLPRRPTLQTEDVSGIEKSGLRNILDKRSDEVRKGIAKTFAFSKKKDKDDARRYSLDRPESATTVKPNFYPYDQDAGYDNFSPPLPGQHQDFSPTSPRQYPFEQLQSPHRLPGQQQQRHGPDQPWQQHQQQQQQQQVPIDAWETASSLGPPPTAKLPPLPPSATSNMPIKRWIGSGRPVARWNKLRKDPELWDPNGDVLIFLGHRGQTPRPPPSFRLSSHIIEATESRYLITLLREGSNEEDMQMPPSPAGGRPAGFPDMRAGGYGGAQGPQLGSGFGRGGQPTPPVSEDASLGEADGQISYEMYFPTPANLTKLEHLRHQLTTRNVFALLYHASLVGLSLFQALSDLQARLDSYMPPESDIVGQIINYLSARGIDDVRSEPGSAVSLLAWAESPNVRWEEGWREFLVHCAGMHRDVEKSAEFRHTTPITRALLERAWLETQLRVQAAEERLMSFTYNDMWLGEEPKRGDVRSAAAAAQRLQKMLVGYYTRVYGSWPPSSRQKPKKASSPNSSDGDEGDDLWLTRTVAMHLQRDFGALYDYLVNRDIVWDGSEARSGRKWELVSEGGNRAFEADTPDVPMTDILVTFDNKQRFPHIPHPFPLVPDSMAPGASRGAAVERRVHLAYRESTNIYDLGSDFTHSDLLEALAKFEKSDHPGEVDPAVARRGRWVLLYGVLQTLASVAVDAPNMRYKDGVAYHLGPRLRGTRIPPWSGRGGDKGMGEDSHEVSHCWVVPATWSSGNGPSASSGCESSGNNSRSASPAAMGASPRSGGMAAASYGLARRGGGAAMMSPSMGGGAAAGPAMRSGMSFVPGMPRSKTSSVVSGSEGSVSGSVGRSKSMISHRELPLAREGSFRNASGGAGVFRADDARALPLRSRGLPSPLIGQDGRGHTTFLGLEEDDEDEDEEEEEEEKEEDEDEDEDEELEYYARPLLRGEDDDDDEKRPDIPEFKARR